jgi:hypothetical protein
MSGQDARKAIQSTSPLFGAVGSLILLLLAFGLAEFLRDVQRYSG